MDWTWIKKMHLDHIDDDIDGCAVYGTFVPALRHL